ncbi:MAG: hypothetical protein IPP78_03430 [Holophagaceae bacterium]|nr:hypothetical protein [Holophagaceae bacterium]
MNPVLTPDARRRITLPALPGLDQPLEIHAQPDGNYLLVPVATVPLSEAWAWTPGALAKTKTGLNEHHAGKGIASTSSKGAAFLKKLEK